MLTLKTVNYPNIDVREVLILENIWIQKIHKTQFNCFMLLFWNIFPCDIIRLIFKYTYPRLKVSEITKSEYGLQVGIVEL
jgi:hypothetical protein